MSTVKYTPNSQSMDNNGRFSVLSSSGKDRNFLHVVTNQYFSILIRGTIQAGNRYAISPSALPNPILIPLLIVKISAEVDLVTSTNDSTILEIQRLNESGNFITAYTERFGTGAVPIARAGLIVFPEERVIIRPDNRNFANIVITAIGIDAQRFEVPSQAIILS